MWTSMRTNLQTGRQNSVSPDPRRLQQILSNSTTWAADTDGYSGFTAEGYVKQNLV